MDDGRWKITILDTEEIFEGVAISFVVPNRKNWVALFGRSILKADYYEKVFKTLLRRQKIATTRRVPSGQRAKVIKFPRKK